MENFQKEHAEKFGTAHNRLINGLLEKGFTFNNCIKHKDEYIALLITHDDVVMVNSSGSVELVSENTNPYEPNDTGQHNWTLWPEDTDTETDFLISTITRITGTD